MHEFDPMERVPMILHCGHTFCKKCIEGTERKMGALQCSLCRSLDFREISLIKKNIIVFQNISPSTRSPLVPCSQHTTQESIFFCLSDYIPFCSKCVIMHKSHDFYNIDDEKITKGTDIEINKKSELAEEYFKASTNERNQLIDIYNSLEYKKKTNIDKINSIFDTLIEEIKKKREDFVECLHGKYNFYVREIQRVIEACDNIIDRKAKTIDNLYKAKKELGRLASTARYNAYEQIAGLDLQPESLLSDILLLKKSSDEVKLEIEVDIGPVVQAIRFLSPDSSIREQDIQWKPRDKSFLLTQNNPKQVELIKTVIENGVEVTEKVKSILESVDRKDFMPIESRPYEDRPQKIGFNTSISAPHMHAYTLNWLEKYLVPGVSVLDIGCGSGYLTVCLAKMIGKGRVFGLDHIEDLINQAVESISKAHPELLNDSDIEFHMITADGRSGLALFAPFNVIHIGAATNEIPKVLLDQLAPGGILMAPVGPVSNFQRITFVEKDLSGNLHYNYGLNVNYAPLTDRSLQCPLNLS
jgi:protein-L-isoaspartate(D-aspartate) O-methyltransferase